MDNLALNVSKSITDFLEHNERRFVGQHNLSEQHDKILQDLQTKFGELEQRCESLTNENASLKQTLDKVTKREEETAEKMITTRSDLDRMQTSVQECSEWVRLITALTSQVQNLIESRDSMDKEFKLLQRSQIELTKQLERQQCQLNATAAATARAAAAATNQQSFHHNHHHRTPIRSPSTSSFFNGNNHIHNQSPIPRYKQQHHSSHYHKEDLFGSLDPNDELSEMSENAESLMKEVQVLNELHRSFEKSSICSDD